MAQHLLAYVTFIQGHTDLNHENKKGLTISETIEAMLFKFAVKIVWPKVYMTIARPMILTFIQGYIASQTWFLFDLQ